MDKSNLTKIAHLLNNRIREFDICAILNALENAGVSLQELLLQGNISFSSPTNLCKEIQISSKGGCVLTLNLGLLMGSSPLPNYFRESIENAEIDEEKFIAFLQFFNHFIIKNFIKVIWIEKFHFDNWKKINSHHLSMLGLDSVSSIHWLISLFFPDLKVQISKTLKKLKFTCTDFQLNNSKLGGKDALGGFINNLTSSYGVVLKADSEQTDKGVFWPKEIRKRLREDIFPLIKKTRIYLIVFLTIDQYNRATHLSPHCYLGYTSLGDATKEFKWLLYEG